MKKYTVYTTVNASFKEPISEEKLAELIKKKEFNIDVQEYMFVLFTEVCSRDLFSFMRKFSISLEEMQDYYEKFIKPVFKSKSLEEMIEI